MSIERLWSGKSRNWLQIWYDIVTLPIEKLMGQFIGVPCVQSYDVRFKVMARRPSRILTGLMISTEETIKLDFNIARTPTTFSRIFAPIQGHTLKENWSRLSWRIISPVHSDGKNSCILWEALSTSTPSHKQDSPQVERAQKKCDNQYSSLPQNLLGMTQEKNSITIDAVYRINVGQGTRERITILAELVSCHYP